MTEVLVFAGLISPGLALVTVLVADLMKAKRAACAARK